MCSLVYFVPSVHILHIKSGALLRDRNISYLTMSVQISHSRRPLLRCALQGPSGCALSKIMASNSLKFPSTLRPKPQIRRVDSLSASFFSKGLSPSRETLSVPRPSLVLPQFTSTRPCSVTGELTPLRYKINKK